MLTEQQGLEILTRVRKHIDAIETAHAAYTAKNGHFRYHKYIFTALKEMDKLIREHKQ